LEGTGKIKRKIINDPVYGFITIPSPLLFNLIEHPYYQRLRRIKQLGLTHLVYPGAMHTRFQHSLGAMHLMSEAINCLTEKGHEISLQEKESVLAAILLHDIGHGPFSHALEHSIVENVFHEEISLHFMKSLNEQFGGQLTRAIEIFTNTYPKKFLHQLVSGQLDMDRLDYLHRDSFYCGVAEGTVNTDRIIKMLNISNDRIVVDAKGIYSLEKFIIARRLMYWQVYLHKAVIAAESLLIRILRRAREIFLNGGKLFCSPSVEFFLKAPVSPEDFNHNPDVLSHFSRIDDFDIFTAIKVWSTDKDPVLSTLCLALVNRLLYRIELQNKPFHENYIGKIKEKVSKEMAITEEWIDYFVFTDKTSSYAYDPFDESIGILLKSGKVIEFTEATEEFDLTVLTRPVVKHILAYPKKIGFVDN
jgi:HD superfamily phosphohydrolase